MPGSPSHTLRRFGRLLIDAVRAWRHDHASLMAAALSFYSLVSIAPLLIVLVALAGTIYGPHELAGVVDRGIAPWVGPEATELIGDLVRAAAPLGSRWTATLIGLSIVLYGSMRVFAELQRALTAIWYGPRAAAAPVHSWHAVRKQLFSFAMVIGVGALWLVGVVASTAIAAIDGWLEGRVSPALESARLTHTGSSMALLTLSLAVVYRVLPRGEARWKAVGVGALVAGLLLTAGGKVIGFYLGITTIRSLYGAAGSLVVIVFWFYYSWLVFFLGAELVKVLTRNGAGVSRKRSDRPGRNVARAGGTR